MRHKNLFFWMFGLAWFVLHTASLAGCPAAPQGGDGGQQEQDPQQRSSLRAIFQLDPSAPKMPFPCDILTQEDAKTPTGRRISLKESKNNGLIDEGLTLFGDIYIKMLNQLDGWSAAGSILVPLEGEIRQDNLPNFSRETPKDAPVVVMDVDPASPDQNKRIPVSVSLLNFSDAKQGHPHILKIQPLLPLRPHTRYLVALTASLQDKQNRPLAASEDFLYVSAQKPIPAEHPAKSRIEEAKIRLQGPMATLEKEGIAKSSLSLAFLVTTGSGPKDLLAARDTILKENKLDYTFDPDKDGKPNLYNNPLEVPNVPAKTRTDDILAILKGTFESPEFRNTKGEWEVEAGRPKLQGWLAIPFLLILPKAIAQGPVPIAVVQHGLSSYKENMVKIAHAFTTRGVAVVAIDTVAHGERSKNPAQAGLEYMAFTSGLRFLDNFRQSAIEHVQLDRLVASFEKLDIYPLGQPDGKPDFLPTGRAYLGHSLGGIIGGLLSGLRPETTMVIAASGGRFEDLMGGILGNVLPKGNESLILQTTTVIQQFLDRADPINSLAWSQRENPTLWEKRQILMQQAMKDETMPAAATWSMARVFSLPQIAPILQAVNGLDPNATPQRGLTQFADALHNYILDEEYSPLTLQAQAQSAHFLVSALKHGKAEVKATP